MLDYILCLIVLLCSAIICEYIPMPLPIKWFITTILSSIATIIFIDK